MKKVIIFLLLGSFIYLVGCSGSEKDPVEVSSEEVPSSNSEDIQGSSTTTTPSTSTIEETQEPVRKLCITHQQGGSVFKESNSDSESIAHVEQNAIFDILEDIQDDENKVWYRIRLHSGGEGWINETWCMEIKDSDTITIEKVLVSPLFLRAREYTNVKEIDVYSDSFFEVEIHFSQIIPQDVYEQFIVDNGNENIRISSTKSNVLELNYTNIQVGTDYVVNFNKDFISSTGLKFEENINLKFNTISPVYVECIPHFDESQPDYFQDAQNGLSEEYTWVEGNLKKLQLRFSEEVDHSIVEEIVSRNLPPDQVKYSVEWDGLSMFLIFEAFYCRSFIIDLESYNTEFYKEFYGDYTAFYISQPTTIYSYNLLSREIIKEYTFEGELCDVLANDRLGHYILTSDSVNDYVLDMNNWTMVTLPEEINCKSYLGMGGYDEDIKWVNPSTILYDENNTFYTYDFDTHTKTQCFTTSKKIEKYACSPTGEYIVVVESDPLVDYDKVSQEITVYALNGEIVCKLDNIPDLPHYFLQASLVYDMEMTWLNNDTILYELGTSENADVVATNIWTMETTTMVEDARFPQYANDMFVCKSLDYQDVIVGANGNRQVIEDAAWGLSLDESNVIYKRYTDGYPRRYEPETYIYNVDTMTTQEMGTNIEKIIGLDKEVNKVYFTLNEYYFKFYD